jgi:hypothetical protein
MMVGHSIGRSPLKDGLPFDFFFFNFFLIQIVKDQLA